MTHKTKTKGRVADYDKEIGIRLRALRKLHSLTQENLAKELGITFQQVQKYEQGTNRISAGKIKQLIDFFKISSTYFFEENEQPKSIGFGENEQESFQNESASKTSKTSKKTNIFQTTETINLLKYYYSIKDTKTRKDLLKLVKTYAENIAVVKKTD